MKTQIARAVKAAHRREVPKGRNFSPKSGRTSDWSHRDQRKRGARHEFNQASA